MPIFGESSHNLPIAYLLGQALLLTLAIVQRVRREDSLAALTDLLVVAPAGGMFRAFESIAGEKDSVGRLERWACGRCADVGRILGLIIGATLRGRHLLRLGRGITLGKADAQSNHKGYNDEPKRCEKGPRLSVAIVDGLGLGDAGPISACFKGQASVEAQFVGQDSRDRIAREAAFFLHFLSK